MKNIFPIFDRLKSIKYTDPELTPENWSAVQPCKKVRILSKDMVLTQPTSTFLVYALGIQTIIVGLYFLCIQDGELSRQWWGISLLLWGIGALLAGTSYQAFAYEIKCSGRQSCSWSSWWEVIYLMFQQVSMNAMLVAVLYSCTDEGVMRTVLLTYALLSSIVYIMFTFIGGVIPIQSFITFNGMVWASTPALIICMCLNAWRYYSYSTPMDLSLLVTWTLLLLTTAVYWLYDELDITNKLWQKGKGIWFSQNDVLHVFLIFWIFYIAIIVADQIKDYTLPVLPG